MSVSRGVQLAGVTALGVVTVVLVVLAMTRTVVTPDVGRAQTGAGSGSTGSTGSSTSAGSILPSGAGEEPAVVSLIGDDHAFREGSWYYRSTPAEPTPGLVRGVELGGEGATAGAFTDQLDQVVPGDLVLVALGSTEVGRGEQPPTIASDLAALVRGIRDADGTPILVTLPPDDDRGFLTKLVNRRINALGERRNVAVADIFTPVATVPGGWEAEFSDDGTYANAEGSQAQAAVVEGVIADVLERQAG